MQCGAGCSHDHSHNHDHGPEKRKRSEEEGENGKAAKKPKEVVKVAVTKHDSEVKQPGILCIFREGVRSAGASGEE